MKVLCRGLALLIIASLAFDNMQVSYAASQEINRVSLIGKYDSADTCTVRSVDTENKQIKFRNHATGKGYTLNYDNTSFIYDQYGRALSASLIEAGEVVDVRFLKSTRHLTYMQVSDAAWTSNNVTSFNLIANEDGIVKINGQNYKMDRSALVIDDGELVSPESILQIDTITVKGIDKDIYSVVVNNGHGYLSLSSDNVDNVSLVGSWIELDNSVIRKVTPNMLLSVAEGEYKLHILGNGADYTEKIEVSSNHETVVDTSKIEIAKPKEGLVTFNVTPSYAQVFVDGVEKLTGIPESIVYGYHSLKVMADGYVTQTKYLKVGTPNSILDIELERDSTASSTEATSSAATVATSKKTTEKDQSSDSASKASTTKKIKDVSGNSKTTTTDGVDSNGYVTGYYINILGPVGSAVYFNGNYVGIAPVKIKKKVGVHAITIDESGTVNSYTIEIDSEKSNVNLTFPTRKPAEKSSDSSSTSSTSSSAASSASSADSASSASSAASASTSDSADSSSSASSEGSTSDSGSTATTQSAEESTTSSNADTTDGSGSSSSESASSTGNTSSDDVSDSATTGICN